MPGTGANSWTHCTPGGGGGGACLEGVVELGITNLAGGSGGDDVTRDVVIAGANPGQYGGLRVDARGDLGGTNSTLTITDTATGATLQDTTGQSDNTYRELIAHISFEVIDLGGGNAGIRLQIQASAGVNSNAPGVPNGWHWEIRISGSFA